MRWKITLMLSAPLLLVALVVGLAGGHLPGCHADQRDDAVVHPQAHLRWQRRWPSPVPWMLKLIVGYTRELFESIPGLIG